MYRASTWLPQLMRASGYGPTSSVSFPLVVDAGGIVGMLIAGRTADPFSAVRVSALWFARAAAGAMPRGEHLPLGVTYVVVAITGVWLFSAQVLVYAATGSVYGERGAALGRGTGVRRTGAMLGPWLGGALAATATKAGAAPRSPWPVLLGAAAIVRVPLVGRRAPAQSGIGNPV